MSRNYAKLIEAEQRERLSRMNDRLGEDNTRSFTRFWILALAAAIAMLSTLLYFW